MKKKFSLWLNIATICLCVCAIAIGVYAVQSATLSVTGSVGFSAHGIEMEITGTLSGYVSSSNVDTATATETKTLDKVTLSKTNTSDTMSLGDFHFTDLVDDGATDIVLTLNLTNKSKFPVEVTEFTLPSDQVLQNNIDFNVQNGFAQMGSISDTETSTQTITITMSLAKEDPTTIDTKDFSISIKFEKYQKVKGDSTTGYYVTMGSNVVTTTSGDNRTQTVTPVKWIPIAKYNENSTGAESLYKYDAFSNKTELTSGSYYFISEKILDLGLDTENKDYYQYGVPYNNTFILDCPFWDTEYPELTAVNYLASSVRALLKGDTIYDYCTQNSDYSQYIESGQQVNLLKEYGIQGYTYSSITARTAEELYEPSDYDISYDSMTDEKYASLKTPDRLWLLSGIEVANYYTNSEARQATTFCGTEQGVWGLRSRLGGFLESSMVYCVKVTGDLSNACGVAVACGVRPAFTLTI